MSHRLVVTSSNPEIILNTHPSSAYCHTYLPADCVGDFLKWVINAIDKVQRPFLWKCQKEVNRGHCLIAWGRVRRGQLILEILS